jgi:cell division protein FtsB
MNPIPIRAYVTIGAVIVLLLGGMWGYNHYTGLVKDLKDAKQQITQLEADLKTEKATSKKLGKDLEEANLQTKAFKELYASSEFYRLEQQQLNRALEKKLHDLQTKLPPVIPLERSSKETPEERSNSMKRIMAIWDLHCSAFAGDVSCKEFQHE